MPGVVPVTIPLDEPTDTAPVLLHTPPVAASLRLVVKPWHTDVFPSIADGLFVIVTVVVV